MGLSAFDHPFLSGLFADPDIAAFFSAEADIAAMLRFETALAEAEAECGVIAPQLAEAIVAQLAGFAPDVALLAEGVSKDGVVIPEFVRQLRRTAGEAAEKVHFGATSQDVIDTSLMLRLKAATNILTARLATVVAGLSDLEARDGQNRMMGYTRMQAAIPITAGERIASWKAPLERATERFSAFAQTGFVVQFGGAAGTLEKFGDKGPAVRAALARRLDLVDRPQWHSQRDGLAEFAALLSLVTGSLGKFGQDVALMAQSGTAIRLTGGGGSSAMPHKQNPVAAEVLVTLARFNASQLAGLHHALVHEQERSGAAWMLEWLMLPQMVLATGVALQTALTLTTRIAKLGDEKT